MVLLRILALDAEEADSPRDEACLPGALFARSSAMRHRARWNRVKSRIEMHLESTRDQCVSIPAAQLSIEFAAFETIHTENSYKFTQSTLGALLRDAGFTIEQTWTDPRQWYALTLAGLR